MNKKFATLGYGYHLAETQLMLDTVLRENDPQKVRDICIQNWPQTSEKNKDRMWRQISKRYLEVEQNKIRYIWLMSKRVIFVKLLSSHSANG